VRGWGNAILLVSLSSERKAKGEREEERGGRLTHLVGSQCEDEGLELKVELLEGGKRHTTDDGQQGQIPEEGGREGAKERGRRW